MRIKNWRKYQHYKHRNPPWIKLHRRLLDDPEWFALSGDACRLLANCWLIASDNNGELPPMKDIAFRLRMAVSEVERLISELDHWVEQDASTMLAYCEQDASKGDPQRQRESQSQSKKEYRFSGKTLRIDDSLYRSWSTSFPDLDLDAQLQSLDDWCTAQGCSARDAVFRVSGALKNRQEAARAKRKPKKAGGQQWYAIRYEYEQLYGKKHALARYSEDARLGRTFAEGKALYEVVCGDDEGQEGTSGEHATQAAGVSDLLPALQAMDHSEED